jgi:tetratricopeptide (TPR) repeat protein
VLGQDAILASGDFVRLNPDVVTLDAAAFKQAVQDGDLELAASLYGGPFLDGFHLRGSVEFDRWVDDERQRFAVLCLEVLEGLALRSERSGEFARAVAWWQRAADHDPFNSRVALALARALAASGDRGNGVQFLREHAQRLQQELEIEPDPEILEAIRTGNFGVTPEYRKGNRTGSEARPERGPTPVGDRVPATDARPGQDAPQKPSYRPATHRLMAAGAVAVIALVGAFAVSANVVRPRHDPSVMAILPFQALGLDTLQAALATLHFHAASAQWPTIETTDPITTAALWQENGVTGVGTSPDDAVAKLAGRLGAGRVVAGHVTPSESGIEVHASMTDAATGTLIASARVTGPSDSLRSAVELLLAHLIAREAGIPEDRIATLSVYDAEAVRLYLQAHRSGMVERHRLLREALESDTSFALAALALIEMSPGASDLRRDGWWSNVTAAAWDHREKLSPTDRAYVEAVLGWRFVPQYTAAHHVAAWQRAVEVAPDRMSHWRGLALACYRWCSELYRNWERPVLETQDTLLALGDQDFDDLERALEVAVLARDTARIRRYATFLPRGPSYGRWLAAVGLGDEQESAELVQQLAEERFALLRLGNVAILTGIALEDAEAAARVPRPDKVGSVYRLEQAVLARERGRHAEYRQLRAKMFQLFDTSTRWDIFHSSQVISEWAYFGEPETDSVLDAHDGLLTGLIEGTSTVAADTVALAHCLRAQLRIERGDTTGLGETVGYLSDDLEAGALAIARMCAPFLELLAARELGREETASSARLLSEVLRERPLDIGTGAGMMNAELLLAASANLVLARTYFDLGLPDAGFAAAIRRPYPAGLWGMFGFHIDFVREEARLLASAGEREAALDTYAKYFRLRPNPPDLASWRDTWYVVRAELDSLLESG